MGQTKSQAEKQRKESSLYPYTHTSLNLKGKRKETGGKHEGQQALSKLPGENPGQGEA